MTPPEKIYIDTNDELRGSILYGFIEKDKDDDIEYIRKDTLIKKACNWLLNNLECYSKNALGTEYLIEDFKKYMEE